MGRWVRWFGSQQEAAPQKSGRAGSKRIVTLSAAEARNAARTGRASPIPKLGVGPGMRAAAPTGVISAEQLPAEVLTALLVQEGKLSPADEHVCLQEHRATGRAVEEIIVESGLLSETELVAVLSSKCKVPHLSLERFQVKPEVIAIVDAEFARANRLVPLEALGKVLNVAMSNPLDLGALKRLEAQTGRRAKPVLVTPRELTQALDKYYPAPSEPAAQEPEEPTLSVKEIFKDSWLASVEEEPQQQPPAAIPSAGAVSSEVLAPLKLTDEEAKAFVRASSMALTRAFAESAGASPEAAELEAEPLQDAVFELLAAKEPLPPAEREEIEESTKTSRSGRRKAVKRKGRKKGGR